MKQAIVTGAGGFIGRALVEELLQHNYRVFAVLRGAGSNPWSHREDVVAVSCDLSHIANLETLIPNQNIHLFFHLAWEGISEGERSNLPLQLQNIQWAVDCVEVVANLGCRRMICAGSICEKEVLVTLEAQGKPLPHSYLYGSAKLTAHCMCSAVAGHRGIELLWPIITNAYGVGERSARLVNQSIRNMLQGKPLRFTKATQYYDFVYITDVARALRLIGERGKPFCEYLIGSSSPRPLREFLMEMRDVVAPEGNLEFGALPFTGEGLPLSVFDCRQTLQDTGFRPEVSFAQGIRQTADWIQKSLSKP